MSSIDVGGTMNALGFHRAIVEELLGRSGEADDDGPQATTSGSSLFPSSLVVLGEGLGLSVILSELIQHHLGDQDRGGKNKLVILVGFSEYHRKCILSATARERRRGRKESREGSGVAPPAVGEIDSSVGATERSRHYALGGCLFITTRILTVDFLQGRLSPLRVSGLYVGSAHRVRDDSGEAFCVRMYRGNTSKSGEEGGGTEGRESNKFGFVHAFTDEPTSFAGTFKVEHVMKALHVRKLFLWPRFESRVQEALQPKQSAIPKEGEGEEEKRGKGEGEVGHGDRLDMPEVVELGIPLTQSMEIIQSALASAMGDCLKELGHHKFLGLEFDLTVSNNLFRDFGRSIQRQLDKRWHLVGPKTKQITRDLSTLRRLAFCVLRYDGPTFLQYLEMLRATEGVNSIWLFLDAARIIFDEAKKRVYKVSHPNPTPKKKKPATATTKPAQTASQVHPVLEQPSKWTHLKQVLEEIQQDRTRLMQRREEGASQSCSQPDPNLAFPVLVLTQEKLVCAQLQHMLVVGGEAIMKDAFDQYLEWRSLSSKPNTQGKAGGSKTSAKGKDQSSRQHTKALMMRGAAGLTMKTEDQALQKASTLSVKERKRKRPQNQDNDNPVAESSDPDPSPQGTPWLTEGVRFYALEGKELEIVLCRVKPAFVVLYDQSPSAIRQLEVYSASTLLGMERARKGILQSSEAEGDGGGEEYTQLLRIYMLFYAESLEQQKFCAAVDRERKVFKSLIEQKAIMMAPIAEDGTAVVERNNLGDAGAPHSKLLLPFGSGSGANNAITRQGGGLLASARKKAGAIIVDMREFSSNSPGVLHAHGFEIVPCTLEVGDYILSPEICVERKAIPDLIQSFGSGRLFQQAQSMAKHYKFPVLLIEFSRDKAFALQGADDWSASTDINQRALGSKLTLLAIHVPRLRIIWSRSPQATAEIFLQLKTNQEEPSLATAQAIGIPEDPHMRKNLDGTNQVALDVLCKLPGVNQNNWRRLAKESVSLRALAAMKEGDLGKAMGGNKKGAKALYNLINSPCVGVPML